jgi:hypothetical protein
VKRLALWIVPLLASQAHADCERDARTTLARYPEYVTYCVGCRDLAPSAPATADRHTSVAIETTYVRTDPAHYSNLAELVDCPAPDQPFWLDVSPASDTGVLITPDWGSHYIKPAPPPPAAAPVVITVPQVMVVQADDDPPWALLAGIAGLATGATGVLCALALRRRRRDVLPRAVNLADRVDR